MNGYELHIEHYELDQTIIEHEFNCNPTCSASFADLGKELMTDESFYIEF